MKKNIVKNFILTFCYLFSAITLASCNCNTPVAIAPIQKSDKKLTCKDVILEINEAEHYRSLGQQGKRITLGEAFMPTCWFAGYMDGSTAVKNATQRINYLKNIYDLLDCDGKPIQKGSGDNSLNSSLPKDFIPLPVKQKNLPNLEQKTKNPPANSSPSSKLPAAPASGEQDDEDTSQMNK